MACDYCREEFAATQKLRGTHEAIRRAEVALEDATRSYLQRHGWTYTSSTPSCCWVWVKEHAGQRLMGDEAAAIRMQKSITCSGCEKPHVDCECTDE